MLNVGLKPDHSGQHRIVFDVPVGKLLAVDRQCLLAVYLPVLLQIGNVPGRVTERARLAAVRAIVRALRHAFLESRAQRSFGFVVTGTASYCAEFAAAAVPR